MQHALSIGPWFLNTARETRDGQANVYDTPDARKTALVVVAAGGAVSR
jgi:hypothetical protein